MTGCTGTDAVVEAIDVSTYTVPTDAPEGDGTLTWDSTTMVLVRAHSGGVVGTGWTYGPPACAPVVHDQLAGVVLGVSVLDVGVAFEAMVKAVRNAGRVGTVGYAISAVDVALWDLKARLLELPLHRLLGAARAEVPIYGSGGFTTYDPDQLDDQLHAWLLQRIPRVKIKIGESWGAAPCRDLARIAQARAVIGPEVELYVDANGGYGRKQAVRIMDAAAEYDVRWLEEPVSSDDLTGLRAVRDSVRPDVAAGEYGGDLTYFQRMCTAGAVDCLQADASRCGGITEWLRVAAVAAAHHLEVSGHCAPHLHAHVAAATPNFRHLEWFHDHVRIERMFFDGSLDPTGGALRLDPSAPGHGLTLLADVAGRYRAGPTLQATAAGGRCFR
ncbi:enolase C-terminal domain-like protein [Pseudonocardia sp.]|jgi:L-alanine-DL-glutamate epimerase-like enolase superfamily enzyme|uniref:enolase C-terminal domain-like protein n=1 Tax=Pseudonocardia sp. TaxID=60912 RepID=UPI0031FC9387